MLLPIQIKGSSYPLMGTDDPANPRKEPIMCDTLQLHPVAGAHPRRRSSLHVIQDLVRAQICASCKTRIARERRTGVAVERTQAPGDTVRGYACDGDCETFRQLPRLAHLLNHRDPMLRSAAQIVFEALKSSPLPASRCNELAATLSRATAQASCRLTN